MVPVLGCLPIMLYPVNHPRNPHYFNEACLYDWEEGEQEGKGSNSYGHWLYPVGSANPAKTTELRIAGHKSDMAQNMATSSPSRGWVRLLWFIVHIGCTEHECLQASLPSLDLASYSTVHEPNWADLCARQWTPSQNEKQNGYRDPLLQNTTLQLPPMCHQSIRCQRGPQSQKQNIWIVPISTKKKSSNQLEKADALILLMMYSLLRFLDP